MDATFGTLAVNKISAWACDTNQGDGNVGLTRLFAELSSDNLDALEELFDVCGDQLYGLALWRTGSPADAEDAVQEVWLRLARSGAALARIRNPRAYLFRMARNAAVDIVSRRREILMEDPPPTLVVVDDVDAAVDGARASELIRSLAPKFREVVYLHDLLGLTFREVAAICSIPLFTAASRHRLAIRRLRALMGVDDDTSR